MTDLTETRTSRRAVLGAFAGIATLTAAPVYAGVFGFLKGAGDIRKVSLRNGRTGENLETIYWIDGKYIKPALNEINYFMRDWREDSVINMDRRNIDLMAAAQNLLDTEEPFQLLSGYRSPRTNAMLRRRSRGVAKKSFHLRGMAADLRMQSRSTSQIAKAGVACRAGGVGRYSGSNFVHFDCGPLRTWRG